MEYSVVGDRDSEGVGADCSWVSDEVRFDDSSDCGAGAKFEGGIVRNGVLSVEAGPV